MMSDRMSAMNSDPRRKRLTDIELGDLETALQRNEWRPGPAARELGIARSSIYELIRRNPTIPESTTLELEEIRAALDACNGDVRAAARRLRVDVERCVAWDHVASPAVDTLRHTAGREYEDLLEEKLTRLGIPFVTEDALRAEGHAKTPDIKLELPIAVGGRIVNWIDSKASFCDPLVHVEKGTDQFQGYVNRFGPGMVIYWLGVIDELAEESVGDVMLVDDFPREEDITKLKLMDAR
jgi:hypothetical protein